MGSNAAFHALAKDIAALESETFEISDYADDSEIVLAASTSSTTSTCSSTTSTTSCCG